MIYRSYFPDLLLLAVRRRKTFSSITKGDGRTMPQHFDNRILTAFQNVTAEFERIYENFRTPEPGGDS